TSSLSSLALWFLGSCRNSSVSRRHSLTFSGETKSTATFVHDFTPPAQQTTTTMIFVIHYYQLLHLCSLIVDT
ncbi:unnamed protein product, partial [Linum tenue]